MHLNKINNQLLFFKNKKIKLLGKVFEYKKMINLLQIEQHNNGSNVTIYDSLTNTSIMNNTQSAFNSQTFL